MQFVPLWDSILDNMKLHRLGPEVIGKWSLLLVCAQRHDCYEGTLPDLETLSFWLRRPEEEIREWLGQLTLVKLLDRSGKTWTIHDWQQWRCTKDPKARERMKRMRERNKKKDDDGEVTNGVAHHVTPPVTEPVAQTSHAGYGVELEARSEQSSQASACSLAEPAAHTSHADVLTGRQPKDHADFLRAVEILEGHESTARLGGYLVMHADTPGVTMFEGWRLIVAAMVAQRPDKTKSWNALLSFARQATLDEFDKLTKPLASGSRLRVHDPGPTNMPVSAHNPPPDLENYAPDYEKHLAMLRAKGQVS